MVEILKVSSKSSPNAVAGALAGVLRSSGAVEMQVIGAGALNQAIKALAIARSYVANLGIDLACRPSFAELDIGGQERTAIKLLVERFVPLQGQAAGPPSLEVAPVTEALLARESL